MDCDGSYDPLLVAELIPRLSPGVDLVTASPYHLQGSVENVPLWRLRLSRLASRLYGAACCHLLSCYTSCFRVYRRSATAPIELDNEGFVGIAELLCKVLAQGGQVVEHPAMLRVRTAGTSKMRVMRRTGPLAIDGSDSDASIVRSHVRRGRSTGIGCGASGGSTKVQLLMNGKTTRSIHNSDESDTPQWLPI